MFRTREFGHRTHQFVQHLHDWVFPRRVSAVTVQGYFVQIRRDTVSSGRVFVPTRCRRCRSNAREKVSHARLTRGTVTSTMRRSAQPSGCARCGAGAGCSEIKYQYLSTGHDTGFVGRHTAPIGRIRSVPYSSATILRLLLHYSQAQT